MIYARPSLFGVWYHFNRRRLRKSFCGGQSVPSFLGRAVKTFAICKRLCLVCFALAVIHTPDEAWAQFNDARAYVNTPIGLNHLELGYAYVHANASIDSSVIVTGAKLNLNQASINYTRYFGLLHRLAWVQIGAPVANLGGSIVGTNIKSSVSGIGDSSYQMAVLLKGGPALNASQFENYKPGTTVGTSVTITAPTGLYRPDKILNLGADRWSFKPEIALSYPFGPDQKWELDAYGNVFFYTDNTSYRGRQILQQEPLPGLEGHLSYSFTDTIWASIDSRYSLRGTTLLNGLNQNNSQQNVIVGSEMNVSFTANHSLTLVFAKALVHQNGPTVVGFSVRYLYTWGKQ